MLGRAGVSSYIIVAAVGALVGGGLVAAVTRGGGSSSRGQPTQPVVARTVDSAQPMATTGVSRTGGPGDYAALYAAVRSSIVEIDTTGIGGRFRPRQVQGQGSGVVLDTKGNVLTNDHVISGAQVITVTFADGTTASAEVVGDDATDDLAIVKTSVGANELHPVTIGDSTSLKVGNVVFAVGNPFGLDGSLSVGVLSGVNRTLQGGGGLPDETGLLQTDAAINEGSSGGGLFDAKGELVGITSALENPDASTFAGVGYAVPINTAKQFMQQRLGQ